MADWIIEQTVEMTRPIQPYTSRPVELMLPGDHLAHTWRIKCLKNGLPVDLTGYTVAGYFKRMDGNYVLISGSISSNTVSVTLTQECYAYPGSLRGVVRIANAETDAVVTLADRLFFVQSAVDDGGTVDPGEVIPSLADLLAEIDAMETATAAAEAAAAAVPDMIAPTFSTSEAYASGDYVYYDGDLYRFTAAHAAGAWTGTDVVEVQLSPEVAGLKSALNLLDTATDNDIGKALSPKTVTNGHVTEWQFKLISGGGGGISDYSDLDNKPQINGVTLTGNKTLANLGIASVIEENLLNSDIPGTTQTVVFDSNGNPTSITHTANNTAVRTDTFVWTSGSVTETRTLASGKYITIATNLTTLETVVSAVQEVA